MGEVNHNGSRRGGAHAHTCDPLALDVATTIRIRLCLASPVTPRPPSAEELAVAEAGALTPSAVEEGIGLVQVESSAVTLRRCEAAR